MLAVGGTGRLLADRAQESWDWDLPCDNAGSILGTPPACPVQLSPNHPALPCRVSDHNNRVSCPPMSVNACPETTTTLAHLYHMAQRNACIGSTEVCNPTKNALAGTNCTRCNQLCASQSDEHLQLAHTQKGGSGGT